VTNYDSGVYKSDWNSRDAEGLAERVREWELGYTSPQEKVNCLLEMARFGELTT